MADLVGSVEALRRRERLSQQEVARALGVTQGHYSKLAGGKVRLSEGLAARMDTWLADHGRAPSGDGASMRIRELATSIRTQCMELMHLAAELIGDPGTG